MPIQKGVVEKLAVFRATFFVAFAVVFAAAACGASFCASLGVEVTVASGDGERVRVGGAEKIVGSTMKASKPEIKNVKSKRNGAEQVMKEVCAFC
ncbi:MAG: hypothetical protein PHD48_05365 [Alphaproteobacteria bacterium]|nr:hypothetical protein [Alphaproteobacteria bacterium]